MLLFIYFINFLYNKEAMQLLKENQSNDDEGELTLVQSYVAWWDMAGFDQAVARQSVNWLEQKAPATAAKNESPRAVETIKTINDKPETATPQSPAPYISAPDIIEKENWPKTLELLHKALSDGTPLPGNSYGDQHISPHYMNITDSEQKTDAKTIMLISDFPNANDLTEKSLLSGKEYQLIVNMLTAAGLEKHHIYCASLASTKPIYDELPDQDLPLIHAFIRHHAEILDPDAIISLGSAACNALLGAELMKSRGNLHYFNFNNKDKTLLTTFHPKTLLVRPNLKRQAWRDLQLLMKKDIL